MKRITKEKQAKPVKKTLTGTDNFLGELRKLRLYVEDDKFYRDVKIVNEPLVLNWN